MSVNDAFFFLPKNEKNNFISLRIYGPKQYQHELKTSWVTTDLVNLMWIYLCLYQVKTTSFFKKSGLWLMLFGRNLYEYCAYDIYASKSLLIEHHWVFLDGLGRILRVSLKLCSSTITFQIFRRKQPWFSHVNIFLDRTYGNTFFGRILCITVITSCSNFLYTGK